MIGVSRTEQKWDEGVRPWNRTEEMASQTRRQANKHVVARFGLTENYGRSQREVSSLPVESLYQQATPREQLLNTSTVRT